MNKILTTVVLALMPLLAGAQQFMGKINPVGYYSWQYLYDRYIWNTGRNIAGLRDANVTASFAELYSGYEGGKLKESWQSGSQWSAGAKAATIVTLPKISMMGTFSFDQTTGKDMCGSMFRNPGYYPFDILEFTPGMKSSQTYSFSGGISTDLSGRWRLGGKIDFESSNTAKRKDIRYTSYGLDLTVAPSLQYSYFDFKAGITPIYHRTTETIDAEQVGTATADSYHAFLDKGLMYGTYEVWNGSGVHLDEAGVGLFPVRENEYGAAAQFQYRWLYAEAEYLRNTGRAGEKGYTWFDFGGNKFSGGVFWNRDNDYVDPLIKAGVNVSYSKTSSRESVLDKVTSGGITTPVIYGENTIFTRTLTTVAPELSMQDSLDDQGIGCFFGYKWTREEAVSTLVYPYVNARTMNEHRIYGEFLIHGLYNFDIQYGAAWWNTGIRHKSYSVSNETLAGQEPFKLQEWYDKYLSYRAKSMMDMHIYVRYNIPKGVMKNVYVELGGAFISRCSSKDENGNTDDTCRVLSSFRLGYKF